MDNPNDVENIIAALTKMDKTTMILRFAKMSPEAQKGFLEGGKEILKEPTPAKAKRKPNSSKKQEEMKALTETVTANVTAKTRRDADEAAVFKNRLMRAERDVETQMARWAHHEGVSIVGTELTDEAVKKISNEDIGMKTFFTKLKKTIF
jgi:hypothetical protein